MRTRKLLLILPAEDYQRLEELGRDAERDPWQQARFLVRQALAAETQRAEATRPAEQAATR